MTRTDYPPILLLRHGQTDWNAIRRIQGQRESDLTETGRGHATRQGEILAGLEGALQTRSLWCSPLRRTRQTAEIALGAEHARVRFDDRLKEVSMGEWEGWLYADLPSRWPEEAARWTNTFDRCVEAPGGEGFEAGALVPTTGAVAGQEFGDLVRGDAEEPDLGAACLEQGGRF